MNLVALSERWYIIIPAYIAAFIPWTAFSTKDFISDKWKTVRRTRVAGYINLFCSIIPAIYIFFYASTQYAAKDWKEGSAAVAALIFALLHAARSAWGLWQLHVFRSWCAESIEALAAMGVTFSFSDTERCKRAQQQKKNAWETSDDILVNNTIVDNQIIHGDAVCHIQYGVDMHLRAPRSPDHVNWMNLLRLIWDFFVFLVKVLFCICAMVLDGLRFSIGVGTSGKLRQVPNRPVEVWINWAVVFAAQGLRQWMSEFNVSVNPRVEEAADTRKKGLEQWQQRASYFASEVLSTCIMQLWPEFEGGEHSKMDPLLWSGWHFGSAMHSGRIVKQELLDNAIESGEGHPFGVAHKGFLHNEDESARGTGYSAFSRHLVSNIAGLGVRREFCLETQNLNVEMLEWLSILMYMGRRSLLLRKEYAKGHEDEHEREREEMNCTGADSIPKEREDIVGESLDQATRNLTAQLSRTLKREARIDEQTDQEARRAIVPSYPFTNKWRKARSSNRHVLKVAEVVDICLALIAGDGLGFILELNEKWSEACKGKNRENVHEQEYIGDSNGSEEIRIKDGDMSENSAASLRSVHREIEKERLRYQFGNEGCGCEWAMNYGMTFMGYKMEAVRSNLAEWAHQRTTQDETNCSPRYRPKLGELENGVYAMHSSCVLSNALSCALRFEDVISTLGSRQFHVRLLRELQDHFESRVRGCAEYQWDAVPPQSPESFEVIALCILSFPSLSVQVTEQNEAKHATVMTAKEWCAIRFGCCSNESDEIMTAPCDKLESKALVIEPVCGPQRCHIQVRFANNESCRRRRAMISLCFEDEKEFVWEWWRDAFTGRLEGMKEWQEDHYMETSLHVIPSLGTITNEFETYKTVANEEFQVWKGWKPFRVEMCMFEVKQSKLLKESETIPPQSLRISSVRYATMPLVFSKPKRRVVSYSQAELRVVFHVTGLIRDAIRQDSRIMRSDIKERGERGAESTLDDLVKKAGRLSKEDFGEVESALLLYESAVGEFGSEEALRNGEKLIMSTRRMSNKRAVELLDIFVGRILPLGKLVETRIDSKILRALRGIVLEICEQLVFRCEGSLEETRLLDILLLVSRFGGGEESQKARKLMEVMICFSENYEVVRRYSCFYDVIRYARDTNGLQTFASVLERRKSSGKQEPHFDMRAEDSYEVVSRVTRATERSTGTHDPSIFVQNTRYLVRLLERAIRKDRNVIAMVDLGVLLFHGADGVPQNAARAKYLWETAIEESGDVYAMVNLGLLLVNGAKGVPRDAVRGKFLYERAIREDGHVGAMINLGILLVNGAEGIPADAVRGKRLYERAIKEGGHVDAMYNLGYLLVHGAEGVPVDAVRARELWERAVNEGRQVDAMYNLGLLLVNGAEGVPVDAVRGKALWETAIDEGGHVGAMTNLGLLLLNGAEGIPRDAVYTKRLWERAAKEIGHVDAMYSLGHLLVNGAGGVPTDAVCANSLWERAIAEGESVEAMFNLGYLLVNGAEGVQTDPVRAKQLFELAIEKGGHVGAMYHLGHLLVKGAKGISAEPVNGKNLWERAIDEGGYVGAKTDLGLLLVTGAEGIPIDAVRAKHLWESAIEDGDVYAMVNLGLLLINGAEGVPSDAVRGKCLYESAIEDGGDVSAMYNLGVLLVEGAEDIAVDAVRAISLWERAIEEGCHSGAMFSLGYLLITGAVGVPQDAVRGKFLYEMAIERGHVDAMVNLGVLLMTGAEGVPVDAMRAKSLFERAIEEDEDVSAMFNLAILLAQGAEGIAEDAVLAKCLYERAIVTGGHVGAMYNLGHLLLHGAENVPKDVVRGKYMYERAVKEGNHEDAMINLAVLLEKGDEGVPQNTDQAKMLFERAIEETKNVHAMNTLGTMLQKEIDKDASNAVRVRSLYEKAIEEGGHVASMVNLGMMLMNDTDGVPMDLERGMHLLERAIEESSDLNAMVCLGFLLGGDDGIGEDASLLRNLFQRASEKSESYFASGSFEKLLARGREGVLQDVERGRAFIQKAKELLGMERTE